MLVARRPGVMVVRTNAPRRGGAVIESELQNELTTTTRRHNEKRRECSYKHRDANGGPFRRETFGMEFQLSAKSYGIGSLGRQMARVGKGTSDCTKIIRVGCVVANP